MAAPRPLRLGLGLACLLVPLGGMPAQERWPVIVVDWARDGKVLISANGLLARFDLDSAQEELLDDSGVTFALSPDGTHVAIAGRNRLELRSYPGFKIQAVLALPAAAAPESFDLDALAWAPDGATLASGTRAGHIHLWDVESHELWADLNVDPPSPVTRLAFSADGIRMLSAFEDGRAVLWDIEKREALHRFEFPLQGEPSGQARAATGANAVDTAVVALSPDGRHVLANQVRAGEAEVLLLDAGGRVEWRRAGYGMEFTPDSSAVLALTPPFRIAALYRTANAEAVRTFEPPEGVTTLYLVRLSPEGTKLLGVGEDPAGQIIIVWDFATGRILKTRR